jgi:hypothetical protein
MAAQRRVPLSGNAEAWQAYVGGGEHGDLEALAFCPECAKREFATTRTASEP